MRSTKEQAQKIKEYIKMNYLEMSDEEMSEALGLTKSTVKTYRCRMGLFVFEQESVGTIKGEIWQVIEDYPDYSISNKGRVKNNLTNKLCKSTLNEKGYVYARFGRKGKQRLHRTVAIAFIPNPDNLPEINHKDFNKQNNSVYNLEWCTRAYNLEYNKNKV